MGKATFDKRQKPQAPEDIADRPPPSLRRCRKKVNLITEHQRKYNKEQGYPEDFCPPDKEAQGFNACLSQIKQLLK